MLVVSQGELCDGFPVVSLGVFVADGADAFAVLH